MQPGLGRRVREQLADPVAELVRAEARRVHDEVGVPPQALHHQALLADPLHHPVGGRQRMPVARRLVPVHERVVGGLEVQDPVADAELLELLQRLRELAEEHPAPGVHHDRDAGRPTRPGGELRHLRQQRRRHVVHHEVAEVLEALRRLGPAGARQAGDDREPRRVPEARAAPLPRPRSALMRSPAARRRRPVEALVDRAARARGRCRRAARSPPARPPAAGRASRTASAAPSCGPGPMPGIVVQRAVRAPAARASAGDSSTAKRCASSRMCCSTKSASRSARDHERLRRVREVDLLEPLREADRRHVGAHLPQRPGRRRELAPAAVDHHERGRIGEPPRVREPTGSSRSRCRRRNRRRITSSMEAKSSCPCTPLISNRR